MFYKSGLIVRKQYKRLFESKTWLPIPVRLLYKSYSLFPDNTKIIKKQKINFFLFFVFVKTYNNGRWYKCVRQTNQYYYENRINLFNLKGKPLRGSKFTRQYNLRNKTDRLNIKTFIHYTIVNRT